MPSSHSHTQHVGFSSEKSLVHAQHSNSISLSPSAPASPSPSPSASPSASASPVLLRASLHRTSYTPISVMRKSYAAPKKSLRFLRTPSPSSNGPTAAQPSTSAALHCNSTPFHYPGVSSPVKPPSRLQRHPLDLSHTSPEALAAFRAAMANALALANDALCTPSKSSPQPTSVVPSAPIRKPSPQPCTVSPSAPIPQPAPQPITVLPSSPIRQPSPQPLVASPSPIRQPSPQSFIVSPSSSSLLSQPALVVPFTPLTLSLGLVSPNRGLISLAKSAVRAAPWVETSCTPDIHMPLTSTPTWSHRTQSAASEATSVLSSPHTNNADGSQASLTDYRLPFVGFTNSILGAVAGRRLWRMPKGSTRKLVEFMARDCSILQSPSPPARHDSVANWLSAVPTPLRQSPPPQTSFLRRPSPVPSSLFGSSTASPSAVEPESPLCLRAEVRDLPVASSCFRSVTASSSSSSSDAWPFGPCAAYPAHRARSPIVALVNEWDDGFAERPIDSPSPPSRLRDIPITPLGSEYFRSSIGAPSSVRDIPITPLGSEYFRSSIGSPCPIRGIPITPLGSEYFRSSIGAPSPVCATAVSPLGSDYFHSSTGSPPLIGGIPITPLGSEYFRSSIGSPGASPVAASPSPVAFSPKSSSLDSTSSSSACSSPLAQPQSPPAPTPLPLPSASPSPAPAPAVTRSPSPAPAQAPAVPHSPTPEPPTPSVAPSSAPEPQLSWKIAAGIVAGAFAITCLASHYLF